MNDIKKGSIVTQSDNFYLWWKCPKFKCQVILIDDDLVYLSHDIDILNYDGTIKTTNILHIEYIKICISETRKQKLLKINERI